MGNYKFRLSDMIPNAWFYKLRDMGKTSSRGQRISKSISNFKSQDSLIQLSSQQQQQQQQQRQQQEKNREVFSVPNRPSYYYSSRGREITTEKLPCSPLQSKGSETHFPQDPPRKSNRRARKRLPKPSTKLISSSVIAGCNCRAWKAESLLHDSSVSEDLQKLGVSEDLEFSDLDSWSDSCVCRLTTSPNDIIIGMAGDDDKTISCSRKLNFLDKFDLPPEIELKPILTKPAMKTEQQQQQMNNLKLEDKLVIKEQSKSPATKKTLPASLHRLKLRTNSPRVVASQRKTKISQGRKSSATDQKGKKQQQQLRRRLSRSFAIVKSSADPQKDFKDSMMEMIIENNIKASKDLEELLACYLSLNSNEYHGVIVKAFEQIWFDLSDIRL